MAYYRAFKALMAVNDCDQEDVAQVLNRSRAYVAERLRAVRPFSQTDMYILCDEFKIDYKDIPTYFPLGGKAKKGTKVIIQFEA